MADTCLRAQRGQSRFNGSAPQPGQICSRVRLPLTLLLADHRNGAGQLQARVAVGVERSGRALNPGAGLEVDGVQHDRLGVGEEGVGVHLSHGAGDAVGPGGGTDQPAVLSESVVNVLRRADGAGFVKVVVLWVAGLEEEAERMLSGSLLSDTSRRRRRHSP